MLFNIKNEKIRIRPRMPANPPNRTHRYLVHIFKKYGEEFEDMFKKTGFINFAVGNYRINKVTNCIHCLADVRGYRNKINHDFGKYLEYFRSHSSYVNDYVYTASFIPYHVIVLSLPEEYSNMIDLFLEGRYTELYKKEDLKFIKKTMAVEVGYEVIAPTYGIITKQRLYKLMFENNIKEQFNMKSFEITDDRQYDYKPNLFQEIFNYKK